jgi:class 3 adenylate cyclase/CHASE2 domain-containing sensor protein
MKLNKKLKKVLIILIMIAVSFFFSIFLGNLGFMKGLEKQLVNLRFSWKNHLTPAERLQEGVIKEGEKVKSDIMIIGIDETSLSTGFLGPWPWERKVHAQFLDYFDYQNGKFAPQYILFDIFFNSYRTSKADRGFVKRLADYLYQGSMKDFKGDKDTYINKVLEVYQNIPSSDQRFFKELEDHPNVFFDYLSQYGEEERLPVEELMPRIKLLLSTQLTVENPEDYVENRIDNEISPLIQDIKPPVPEIIKHAMGVGSAWVEADADGTIRQMPLLFLYYDPRVIKNPVFLPTIDLIYIMKYFNVTKENLEIVFGKHIKIKNAKIPQKEPDPQGGYRVTGYVQEDVTIPIDGEGKMYINYQGTSHSFDNMSYAFITADTARQNAPLYKDRVLLVGFFSTAGLGETKDYFNTPYGSMYGIEIHANAIYTIANRKFIMDVPISIEYIYILLLIVGIAILFDKINIIKGLIAALFSLFIIFIASGFLFSGSLFTIEFIEAPLYLLNMTTPLAAIIISLILSISYKVVTEEKDKRFLKSTFSQYISPELIDIMYEHQTMPRLGGASDILTAYFTDIQGFSSFSEKLTATQLVELLNEYLSAMTDILISEKGTLDKYEGDAIIAFFGAPMKLEDNALRACRVAIKMQDKLGELREKWKSEMGDESRNTKNLPPDVWRPGDKWPKIVHDMRMRIGINTGEIVTGNMGSKMRMNYTMMGDSVNLAARLESGAKQYGVFTLISEMTYHYEFEDENGKKQKISDFFEARFLDRLTVVGKSEPVAVYELINLRDRLTDNERKLLPLFKEAMTPDNKINPSRLFAMRCDHFKENPPVKPGEAWDGVYRLTSK